MPTESAFLLVGLLFLAAALGYVFARFGDAEKEDVTTGPLSSHYLKGLNFLLNEEPDRAVEVFTEIAEFDDDTLETHLALGSLFRKRGEVGRAIRIHQNLMARPSLSHHYQDQARMALAADYLSAGLLDRAESLYQSMRESEEFKWQALESLIRIFELTKEWDQAIISYEELERLNGGADENSPVAHYYCELAEQARAAKDYPEARAVLKKAESVRPGTVRSTLIRADIAQDLDEHKTAIKLYEAVARQAPALLLEVIPRLAASCRATESDKDLTRFLEATLKRDSAGIAAVAMATVLNPDLDNPVALNALQEFVMRDTTLGELVDGPRLASVGESEREQILARIRKALRDIVSKGNRYRCRNCGYATLILQWQCPSCQSWETVLPETRINLTSSS